MHNSFSPLPKDGRPIITWSNRDNAYLDIARGIYSIIEDLYIQLQQVKGGASVANNYQQSIAEVEAIRTRCKQGKLIITNKRILIEMSGFGQILKSQMLLRSSLTSIESTLVAFPIFGKGGGMNLIFHGKGRELLQADLVPPSEAKKILLLLN